MYHLEQLENIISEESIKNLRNFLQKINGIIKYLEDS